MSFKDWLTKNIYVTSPGNPDPFFRPRHYQKPREEVVKAVNEVADSLPGWKVEEYRENQGRFRISRGSFLLWLASDINIYVIEGLDGFTQLEMTSMSRSGKGDWGQNKRNVLRFLNQMDSRLPPLPALKTE